MAHAYARACRGRCSFKQATLVVCACNLLMLLYISQWLLVYYYVPASELPLVYFRQADGTHFTPRALVLISIS